MSWCEALEAASHCWSVLKILCQHIFCASTVHATVTMPSCLQESQDVMREEEEGRPSKVRKLSHDVDDLSIPYSYAQTDSDALTKDKNVSDVVSSETETKLERLDDIAASETGSEKSIEIKVDSEASYAASVAGTGQPLSKNQAKKLRKKLEWEAGRDDRKSLRKEKLAAKRERRKLAKQSEPEPAPPPEHIVRKQLPITIIIDCDFDQYMHDGERTSLASQVTRSYSDNKNARFRAHLTISSFGGYLKQRFDGLLNGMYKNWRGVRFLEGDFVDVSQQAKQWMNAAEGGVLEGAFNKYNKDHHQSIERLQELGEVVYLSAEADETLEELKPFSTYIIGGLVDKNREKGLCHRRATERGVRTARLPIGKYLDMSSRKVLTTNHVNEIMLKWLETADWGEAFISVIPKRKGGQLKDTAGHDDAAEEHEAVGGLNAPAGESISPADHTVERDPDHEPTRTQAIETGEEHTHALQDNTSV